jgi:hypothetical protein
MTLLEDLKPIIQPYLVEIRQRIATESGDWIIKGFIDVAQRIYTPSLDTKVLSKVLEILVFHVVARFADENDFQVIRAGAQNQYPDISLVHKNAPSLRFAIDIKTTYRTGIDGSGNAHVNGMTLGTFGGYFRRRDVAINSVFPYGHYLKHYVLGIVYSRVEGLEEDRTYTLAELASVPSVIRNFDVFFHEKYQIASDQPGSGNTKNIGSTKLLHRLLSGSGVFSTFGVEVFDDYWMNYQTRAMAKENGYSQPPYSDLRSYRQYKARGTQILAALPGEVFTESDLSANEDSDTGDAD